MKCILFLEWSGKILFLSIGVFLAGCSVGGKYGGSGAKPPPQDYVYLNDIPYSSDKIFFDKNVICRRGQVCRMSDINDYFKSRFRQAGYSSVSYYVTNGGFAIATPVEGVNCDGTPKQNSERWVSAQSPSSSSMFRIPILSPGNYGFVRSFVVYVSSDMQVSQNKRSATREEIESLSQGGMDYLPEKVANMRVGSQSISISSYSFVFVDGFFQCRGIADTKNQIRLASIDIEY